MNVWRLTKISMYQKKNEEALNASVNLIENFHCALPHPNITILKYSYTYRTEQYTAQLRWYIITAH